MHGNVSAVARYEYKTTPYAHQVEGIQKLIKNGYGGALLMAPRTGKTKTTIDYLSILAKAGRIDRAVVICPSKVMDVWQRELHAHCPLNYAVHIWDAEARKNPPPPVQRVNDLTILLINYEAFGTPGKRLPSGNESHASGRWRNRKLLMKWRDGQPTACVLDESHKIKSPSGKISNMIEGMAPAFKYRVILTGTPVTKANRMFDIYMQWKFLNPERFKDVPTLKEFKNRYGVWTDANGYPQFLRPRKTKELKKRIHKDAFAITREECFDLPPKTTNVRYVKLTDSAPVYDDLANTMVAEFEHNKESHTTEASIALTLALRLSQITGGSATTESVFDYENDVWIPGKVIPIGFEKLEVINELVDEAIENDEKIVIAARFRSDLDRIMHLCSTKKVPTYPIRGGLKRAEVADNIERFRKRSGVGVCALNPAAGGLGIDLSTASHMVWYSLTPSWVDFTQACDRIALSENPTTFTFILAQGTVDELLYKTLQEDGDVANEIVRNPRKVLRK